MSTRALTPSSLCFSLALLAFSIGGKSLTFECFSSDTVQKQQSLDWLLTCEAVICRFFDDLRPYALVQFVPCIVIPLMAILLPPMYTHSTYWLWAAGLCSLSVVEADIFFSLKAVLIIDSIGFQDSIS